MNPLRLTGSEVQRFGDSIDEVLEAYPALEGEDVYACIQFAAKLMANQYQIQKIA